jgi:serine/threonine-protein kinase
VTSTQPSAPPSEPGELAAQWIGRVIEGRYKVVEVLGEGGMGAVFVAEHLKLRKLVAIKTIRNEFAGDGQAEARFEREVRATATIEHPHVVSALDCGHLPDGGAFLVVALVRGQSLGRHLERGPLHWRQVAELGAQIADALATCHAAGVIHRDLKPDNVLLEPRDDGSFHARVVDFGIARLSDEAGGIEDSQPLTRMGAVIGTPGYMAPEQAVGQTIDHRVDLYALGVILWESCTGRRLWEGDSLTELFARQLASTAPSLHDTPVGQVPEALAELTGRLIAPLAANRPQSAAAVRDELRRLAFSGDALVSPSSIMRAADIHGGFAPATSQLGATTIPGAGPFTPSGTQITGAPPLPLQVRLRFLASQLPRNALYGGGAALLVLLVLVARCACGDAPPEPPRPAEQLAAAEPPAADDRPKKSAAAREPEKQPEAKLEPPPEPPPEPPAVADEVPAAYADAVKTLTTVPGGSKSRKKAAETITSAKDADKALIPEYIRNLAWLERNGRCEDKRKIVLKIEEAGDARALAGLQMFAKTPKKGCREWFRAVDCFGCLREDLGRVIGRFEAEK